jgi:tetratricopeptide (TPR) repeat protein
VSFFRRIRQPRHPRVSRGCLALATLLLISAAAAANAQSVPFIPASTDEVLAHVPPGTSHASIPQRMQADARLDVALPLAQYYISQARSSGDMRFLGYAESTLAHWTASMPPAPPALVLQATILQSRHDFAGALADLDRALRAAPEDAQAWLTRATVLRVLSRYPEALQSCGHLRTAGASEVALLCTQSVRAVSGHLREAYAATRALSPQSLPGAARAWRYSLLGEMAVALGDDVAAAHWFRECLAISADDSYTRSAYADLLLRQASPQDALQLLSGYESMEPILLRIAIAQRALKQPGLGSSRATLTEAFTVEEQRGEAVHRREQARFLLDVMDEPAAALAAARQNWQVQREPEDLLILLRAAQAAHDRQALAGAAQLARAQGLEDARLQPYLGASG